MPSIKKLEDFENPLDLQLSKKSNRENMKQN